ncbi:hypothetical protein PRZ48_006773 [Zasmidium cellare]|uniref:Glutathione S-transferase n=1 Tax=Zasmidium cellare TaxID=395010 RepID=A0ABR0EHK8_ZASCE|nr:hypothetical protein PRZ48_006773 [Zasmidium cellare]
MKYTLTFSVLLAAAAAHPFAHQKRFTPQPGLRTTPAAVKNQTGPAPDSADADTIYSYNWSGGYVEGSGVTIAYGTVVVPAVSIPPGGDSNTVYSGAAWVGIDGDNSDCGTLLQTGITWQIGGGQGASYGAWYEWVPDEALTPFDNFNVNQGDTIIMKVVASSSSGSTGGAAYITNESAEWIVEDLTVGGSFAPFAAFDPIAITAAGWGNDQGTYDLSGAGIFTLITSSGQSETDVSIPNNSEVDVSKIRIILEELGVPYRNEYIVFQEVKAESYTKLNPNGRLPTIHDPNTGITLWEFKTGAITAYLIDQYDKEHRRSYGSFPEKYHMQQWIAFQISGQILHPVAIATVLMLFPGQGPYYGQGVWFSFIHPEKLPTAMERYDKEIERVRSVLDTHLRRQASAHGDTSDPWFVGDKCTVADLSFVMWENVVDQINERKGIDLKGKYPAYDAWKERLFQRPACKKSMDSRAEAMEEQIRNGPFGRVVREDAK